MLRADVLRSFFQLRVYPSAASADGFPLRLTKDSLVGDGGNSGRLIKLVLLDG